MEKELTSIHLNEPQSRKDSRSGWLDARTLLVLLAFCEKNVVRYIVLAISMIPLIGQISTIIVPALYVILLAYYIVSEKVRLNEDGLLFLLFAVFSIVFSCVFYPENTSFILDMFWSTIFPCFKFFLIGLIVVADEDGMRALGRASCLAILVEVLFVFAYMMPQGLLVEEDMSRSYQLLPNTLLAFNYAMDRKKVLPWLFSLLGMAYHLMFGSRGPVVIVLAFVVLRMIFGKSANKTRKRIVLVVIAAIIVFFSVSGLYSSALHGIKTLFQKQGLSTRIIDFAIRGDTLGYMSDRDVLYETAMRKIAEKPFFGYGVYGEWPWIGWSIHNLYIEVIIHFGLLIGAPFLGWVLLTVLRAYLKTKNDYAKELIIVFGCNIFIRGLFGGSWLSSGLFFLLAFCIKELNRIKNNRLYV